MLKGETGRRGSLCLFFFFFPHSRSRPLPTTHINPPPKIETEVTPDPRGNTLQLGTEAGGPATNRRGVPVAEGILSLAEMSNVWVSRQGRAVPSDPLVVSPGSHRQGERHVGFHEGPLLRGGGCFRLTDGLGPLIFSFFLASLPLLRFGSWGGSF